MNFWKITAITCIIAVALIAAGLMFGASTMVYFDGKWHTSDVDYISETINFSDIHTIDAEVSEIDVEVLRGSEFQVAYVAKYAPEISEADGVLSIKSSHKNTWFSIGLSFWDNKDKSVIKITIPEGVQLADVFVKNHFGDSTLSNVYAANLEVHNSNGDIEASRTIVANDAQFENDFGDITVDSLEANSMTLKNSNGDIGAAEVTIANDALIENHFGDIELADFTANRGVIADDNGDVDAARITGVHNFESHFGSINIALDNEDYQLELSTKFGDIEVNGKRVGNIYTKGDSALENKITATSSNGDIEIN